jgi:hypothetical protein
MQNQLKIQQVNFLLKKVDFYFLISIKWK